MLMRVGNHEPQTLHNLRMRPGKPLRQRRCNLRHHSHNTRQHSRHSLRTVGQHRPRRRLHLAPLLLACHASTQSTCLASRLEELLPAAVHILDRDKSNSPTRRRQSTSITGYRHSHRKANPTNHLRPRGETILALRTLHMSMAIGKIRHASVRQPVDTRLTLRHLRRRRLSWLPPITGTGRGHSPELSLDTIGLEARSPMKVSRVTAKYPVGRIVSLHLDTMHTESQHTRAGRPRCDSLESLLASTYLTSIGHLSFRESPLRLQ